MTKERTAQSGCSSGGVIALSLLSVGAVWLLYTRSRREFPPLPPAVAAPISTFTTQSGIKTAYYADTSGEGTPLVLIHSINAAPSAYEVKPLFEYYQGKRPVYALELPGFGQSDRTRRRYSPQLFADTIRDFLANVVGAPAHVLALSLSSEFIAIAANAEPDRFASLVVVSPTGFSKVDVASFIPGKLIYGFVSLPLLDEGLFDLLTRRGTVSFYLDQSFVSGDAPADFIDYAYTTAQQKNARHAPLYFLSGQLFSADVAGDVYAALETPTLMIYDEDPNVSFERLPALLEANPNWRAERLQPSRGLPHWEKLEETVALLEDFWQGE